MQHSARSSGGGTAAEEAADAAAAIREVEARQLAELLTNLSPEELKAHYAKTQQSDSSKLSPANWGSTYNDESTGFKPAWAPTVDTSALGQLQAKIGAHTKWNTIRKAFMRFDCDGNGVIDRGELEQLVRAASSMRVAPAPRTDASHHERAHCVRRW
jgi:hypothetical protein